MDQLQIRSTEGPGGILILHLEGALTLTTLFEFQDTVRKQQASGLIIELSGVPYMDSAGLGACNAARSDVAQNHEGRHSGSPV